MIYVYNKSLTNYKEITHAISIKMLEYYNDIGKATLFLPIDDYNISAIENDGIIYDSDRDVSFTIQNHKYDTTKNEITVNAYTCNWLLNKRVLASKISIRNVETAVYIAISNNLRGLPFVEVATSQGFPEEADSLFYGGQVLDKLMPTLEEAKIGQKMVFDPDARKHIFTLYKGRDLTTGIHAVTFSEEQGTAKNLVITEDISVLKNVIYVQGILTDDTEIVERVVPGNYALENADACEHWLRDTLRQENDESQSEFISRMWQRGRDEIAARIARETFAVTIDTSEYGEIYRLGDVVSCVSLRFNVEFTSRITGVEYTLDRNGEKLNLILGEPILTALGEAKLNG